MGVKQLLKRWRITKSLPLTERADGEAIGRGENTDAKAPTATGYSRHGWLPRRTAVLQRVQSSNSSVALANVSRLVRPLKGLCCPGGQQTLGSKITKLPPRWSCISIKKHSIQRRADDNRWGLNNASNLKLTSLCCLTLALISILTINLINSNYYGTKLAKAVSTNTATIANTTNATSNASSSSPYISLSLSSATGSSDPSNGSNIAIQVPDAGGLATGSHALTIKTNAVKGYNVTVLASGDQTSMVNSDNSSKGIERLPLMAMSLGGTGSTLSNNTWGLAPSRLMSSSSALGLSLSPESTYQSTDQAVLKTARFVSLITRKEIYDSSLMGNLAKYIITAAESSQPTGSSHDGADPDQAKVYYGVRVDNPNDYAPGGYSVAVTYTATITLPAAPTITGISPNAINTGNTAEADRQITITGTNLESTYQVYIDLNKDNKRAEDGSEDCTSPTVTDIAIACIAPASSTAATHDVYAVTHGGTTVANSNTKLTYRQTKPIHDKSIVYMQDMTSEVCNDTTTPSASIVYPNEILLDTNGTHHGDEAYIPEKTLIDKRDNKSYKIRKLADGNCWMVENLALGTGNSTGIKLTNQDTDLHSQTSFTLPAFTNIGVSWSYGDNTPRVVQGSTTASSSWKQGMGNWYTWGAATANTAKNATSSGTKATDSICSAGWQLPDNDGAKSYYNLATTTYSIGNNSTGSTKLRSDPLSLTYAGRYNYNGSVSLVGSYGYYWSSAVSGSDSAYNLFLNSSYVYPQDSNGRGYGFLVRCVAR